MRLIFVTLFALFFAEASFMAPADHKEAQDFVLGQVLVKIDPDFDQAFQIFGQTIGAKKIQSFAIVEGLALYQFDPTIDVGEVVKSFMAHKAVQYAEPNYIYSVALAHQALTNDPDFLKQWALENSGQSGGTLDADINASSAWDIEKGSKEVVVAVIDTGVDFDHPDLADNMWKNPGEIPNNNKDDDNNGYIDDVYGINAIRKDGRPMDDNLHGTHVAGIIGAVGHNNLGISGVAQSAQIVACKFLSGAGFGNISDAITCMDYVLSLKTRKDHAVNIVATNNSWGGGARSEAMFDAIKAHERAGIIFVAAAGNYSNNNDIIDVFPATYKVSNVVAVAATDNQDRLASFSNYGQLSVHVAAPGAKIYSTLPNNKYGELSGTSMAAPQAAGLLALIASRFRDLPYTGIRNLLLAGGQKIPSIQNKTIGGRRIRAQDKDGVGSLSCENQVVIARQTPSLTTHRIEIGKSLFLSAIAINCAESTGSVILWQKDDEKIIVQDLGENGDETAHDGIASLLWFPTKEGQYQLRFSDNDVVNVTVFKKADEKK